MWEPYRSPQSRSSFGKRLRRNSFSIVLTLSIIGIGALLYFAPQPYDLNPEYATLSIYSTPDNAAVIIGGDTVGVTPIEDYRTRPGAYVVSITKENYVARDTVLTLRAEQPNVYTARLSRRYAWSSTEQGARPGLSNGGRSEPDLAPNDQQVRDPDQNFSPDGIPETERGEEESDFDSPAVGEAAPPRSGLLEVRSDPESTAVEFDGKAVGRTPLRLDSISPGSHEVTFLRPGHETVTRQIEVAPGETVTVKASLEALVGRLRILVRPWGSISIEDQLRVQNSDLWYETELPVGTYTVTARHPTLGQKVQTVQVTANDTESVVFDMREE